MFSNRIFSNHKDNIITITTICSELKNGKVEIGKHYCCSKENCTLYTSSCTGSNYEISLCHNISTYGPCRRTDYNAAQACGGLQDYSLCISSPTKTILDASFYRLSDAVKYIVNRSTEEDSREITVCDNGIGFSPCNETSVPSGTIAFVTCGDLYMIALGQIIRTAK